MKIRKFLFVAIVICHVFCSCSSSTDTVIEDNVDKEQAHFEGVFNANSVIVHPGTNNWYGIDISRANTFTVSIREVIPVLIHIFLLL
mgnify:CR=1 FL=1